MFANTSESIFIKNCLFERCFSTNLVNNQGGNAIRLHRCIFTLHSSSIFRCFYTEEDPGDSPILLTEKSVLLFLDNFSHNYGYDKKSVKLTGAGCGEMSCESGRADQVIIANCRGFRMTSLNDKIGAIIWRSIFIDNNGSFLLTCYNLMHAVDCYFYRNRNRIKQNPDCINLTDCFGDIQCDGISKVELNTPNVQPLGYYKGTRISRRRYSSNKLSTMIVLHLNT